MARLSRTQRYQELRDQMSHDREEVIETKELSPYQDKLTNVQNNIENRNYAESEIKKAEEESLKSLDDILAHMMDNFDNEPVIEDKPFINNEPQQETQKSLDELASTLNAQPETQEAPIDPMDAFANELNSLDSIEQEMKVNVSNDFINNTMKEVTDYNKQSGNQTLDQIPNQLIDEVVYSPNKNEAEFDDQVDDDFSSTVSLEIDKVLSEIGAARAMEEEANEEPAQNSVMIDETAYEEEVATPEPVIEEPIVIEEPVQQVQTFEHPVLAQELKEEEPVVEIKNIDDTFKMQVDDSVVDDTIPFDVDEVQNQMDDDEYDDEDEYEDEAPSKVLNVILGILIFVLIAVLGVIVYYILVAKGIIG